MDNQHKIRQLLESDSVKNVEPGFQLCIGLKGRYIQETPEELRKYVFFVFTVWFGNRIFGFVDRGEFE